MVALTAAQERNYREAFDTTRSWAKAHGKDPGPLLDRVSMVLLTESNGRNYANDGLAYADNAEKVRPGWVVEADGKPMTLEKRRAIRAVLRKSLDMPNDGVGNNGGSTGVGQQLSQEFVAVRFPGARWGYGTVAATMDVANAVTMFLGRLVVTTNPDYAGITFSDPLVADVLRVQQPKISEHQSDNYNADQVAVAKAIVAQLAPDERDGFGMASLDDLAKIVKDNAGTPIADTAKAVQSVVADVDKLTEWLQGGYDGSSKEQTNVAGIWRRADNVQQMLVGGYQGSTTTAKNNVDAIYWMLLNLCTALIPNVKHPDRAPNDQADPAPAADVQS